jgi:hypothetical protein
VLLLGVVYVSKEYVEPESASPESEPEVEVDSDSDFE